MIYNKNFYDQMTEVSLRSARKIVPFLISNFPIKNVIDFGCGNGAWLKAFDELTVEIVGIEGNWIRDKKTLIPKDKYQFTNFEDKNLNITEKYDIALCMEVAEHLSEPSAEYLIEQITSVTNKILFSAAIPLQGGTGHINEQWQSYWAEKFIKHSFYPNLDIRNAYWNNKQIAPYFRQNMLIYERINNVNESYKTNDELENLLNIVHPQMYLLSNYRNIGLKRCFIAFKNALKISLKLMREMIY